MALPAAEAALKEFLGDRYTQSVWETALKQLIEVDGDGDGAFKIIADIRSSADDAPAAQNDFPSPEPAPAQLVLLEKEFMDQVADLRARKRISAGGMPSIDELLDPPEERYIKIA
ncbi:hypothetical protein B0H14DRAFT_3464528 [Mycena olivaceomarginata]|nr:hypothetical protein B0H14DRAFT_3464528 [Mycena olivaceomarginata]